MARRRKTSKKRPRNPREKSDHSTSGAWYVIGDRGQKIYIADPSNWYWNAPRPGSLWLLQFGGPYSVIWVAVWEKHLEDALDTATEWLAQYAPGLLTTEEELWQDKGLIEDAMKDVGVSGPFDELDEEDQYKVHESMTTDMTYTESGYVNSWEWYAHELGPGDDDYKKILVESVREDPDMDDAMVDAYQKAMASTRRNKGKQVSGEDYAKKNPKRKRGRRSNPKKSKASRVSGRKRNPDTAAAKRRAMRG